MLKKISAALIAVSMLAAPAMAAGDKTAPAPITKPVAATDVKPVTTVASKLQVKPALRNAHARMGRHHHGRRHHVRHHHRFHHRMSANKIFKHTAIKTTVTHFKRG